MSFFKDIRNGFASYANAYKLVKQLKLQKYLFISGCISLLLGLGVFGFSYLFYDDIGSWFSSFYTWEKGKGLVDKLSNLIGGLSLAFGGLLIYKYVLIIILSPFMSLISEKIELRLYNQESKQSIIEFGQSILRGLRLSLRNIIREMFLLLLLLFLSLFPVINFITTPMMFFVQAYYAGFGNMDYTMERHLSFNESIFFVKNNKGVALANGTIFLLLLFIPIVGLFVAPIFATVASTKEVLNKLDYTGGTNL